MLKYFSCLQARLSNGVPSHVKKTTRSHLLRQNIAPVVDPTSVAAEVVAVDVVEHEAVQSVVADAVAEARTKVPLLTATLLCWIRAPVLRLVGAMFLLRSQLRR